MSDTTVKYCVQQRFILRGTEAWDEWEVLVEFDDLPESERCLEKKRRGSNPDRWQLRLAKVTTEVLG